MLLDHVQKLSSGQVFNIWSTWTKFMQYIVEAAFAIETQWNEVKINLLLIAFFHINLLWPDAQLPYIMFFAPYNVSASMSTVTHNCLTNYYIFGLAKRTTESETAEIYQGRQQNTWQLSQRHTSKTFTIAQEELKSFSRRRLWSPTTINIKPRQTSFSSC